MIEARYYQENHADRALEHADRGKLWETYYRAEIKSSVDIAITALKLDKPYEGMDDKEKALADALFGSILSCFGPSFRDPEEGSYGEKYGIYQSLHGVGSIDIFPRYEKFTSNHNAVGVSLYPLDSDGKRLSGSPDHMNMPTFVRTFGGKATFGDISPISIIQVGAELHLYLVTPGGHIWNKLLEKRDIDSVFDKPVGIRTNGATLFARDIVETCSFTHPVTKLRLTCEKEAAGCKFCGVTRGDGIITPEHQKHVLKTFHELIFDEKARKYNTSLMLTLSGGSENSPDGGFHTAHEWALGKIEEEIREAEKIYGKKINVDLELEMMLPPDTSPDKVIWRDIIRKINHYVEGLGWNIGLALNVEAYDDETRRIFIPGRKGEVQIGDLIEFAGIVEEETKENKKGEIDIGTLGLDNLKPAAMSSDEHMTRGLRNMLKLIDARIHPDLIPSKIDPGQDLEAYPPPDPILYMIQYFALKQMIDNAKLKPKHGGCVIKCGHCHHVDATYRAMAVLRDRLAERLGPILEIKKLGPEYTETFTNLFSKN